MENEKNITEHEDRAIKLFGSKLAQRMKKLMELNGDETIGEFILNSAFEFLDEFELRFKFYINENKADLGSLKPLNIPQARSSDALKTENMAKVAEIANKIVKIYGYKTVEDIIHYTSRNFLDRIEKWFEPSLPDAEDISQIFHFNSKIENISDNDSEIEALKKFQALVQKEFVSYIQRIPW